MTVLVDASAFYALLDGSDVQHARAIAWLDDHSDERYVTNGPLVTEVTGLLDRRIGTAAGNEFVDAYLPSVEVLHPSAETFARALVAYRTGTGKRRPSLTDCIAFEMMRELRIDTAFTFDDHFARAGFRVVPGD